MIGRSIAPTSDFNTKVIDEFRANDGKVGGPFEGAPIILIHHVGAKSGKERVTPLVRFPEDDGSMVIVASKAGAPDNPDWYHNVKANPRFEVEVGAETFPVEAEEVPAGERDEVWARIVAANPGFDAYQDKTDRVIPLIRLRRA